MITQHFNGEIVEHPDHKGNRVLIDQRRETKKICSFAIPERLCSTFHNWQMERPKERLNCGRCPLSDLYTEQIIEGVSWKTFKCPRAQKRYVSAIQPKRYCIDSKVYRKLASAAGFIIKDSKYKTLFLTLTFGKFKKNEISERNANKCFSKFVENLRETYGIEHYLCVRERGEDNNRLHYHLVVSLPFVSFVVLNRAWCHATKEYCEFSKNSLQSDKTNRVIRNPARAVRYICKYLSKGLKKRDSKKEELSLSRIYFISNNTLSSLFVDVSTGEIVRRSNIKQTLTDRHINITQYIEGFKGIKIKLFDFATIYRFTDVDELQRFNETVIYPLFNCLKTVNGLKIHPK